MNILFKRRWSVTAVAVGLVLNGTGLSYAMDGSVNPSSQHLTTSGQARTTQPAMSTSGTKMAASLTKTPGIDDPLKVSGMKEGTALGQSGKIADPQGFTKMTTSLQSGQETSPLQTSGNKPPVGRPSITPQRLEASGKVTMPNMSTSQQPDERESLGVSGANPLQVSQKVGNPMETSVKMPTFGQEGHGDPFVPRQEDYGFGQLGVSGINPGPMHASVPLGQANTVANKITTAHREKQEKANATKIQDLKGIPQDEIRSPNSPDHVALEVSPSKRKSLGKDVEGGGPGSPDEGTVTGPQTTIMESVGTETGLLHSPNSPGKSPGKSPASRSPSKRKTQTSCFGGLIKLFKTPKKGEDKAPTETELATSPHNEQVTKKSSSSPTKKGGSKADSPLIQGSPLKKEKTEPINDAINRL